MLMKHLILNNSKYWL